MTDNLINKVKKYNIKYIIKGYNHPNYGDMTPDYRTKRENIRANKQLQEQILTFSEQD